MSSSQQAPQIGQLKFQVGFHTDIGNKRENQDIVDSRELVAGIHFLAVYDGHGTNGKECAEFARTHLPVILAKEKDLEKQPSLALRNAFMKCHEMYKKNEIDIYLSGTTATVALIQPSLHQVVVANVGDSGAILLQRKQGIVRAESVTW
eukprot:Sdes_comp18118_c0_seq2m7572